MTDYKHFSEKHVKLEILAFWEILKEVLILLYQKAVCWSKSIGSAFLLNVLIPCKPNEINLGWPNIILLLREPNIYWWSSCGKSLQLILRVHSDQLHNMNTLAYKFTPVLVNLQGEVANYWLGLPSLQT